MTPVAARALTIFLLIVTLGVGAYGASQSQTEPEHTVSITYGDDLPEGFSVDRVDAALGGSPIRSWEPVTIHVTAEPIDRYDDGLLARHDADLVLTALPTWTVHEYQFHDAAGDDVEAAPVDSLVADEALMPWFDKDQSVVTSAQLEALYNRNRDLGHDAGAVASVARAVAPLTYDGPPRDPWFWGALTAASGVATGAAALLWLRAVRARAEVLRTLRRARSLTSRVLLGLDAVELSHLTVPVSRHTPRLAASWETLRAAAKELIVREAHISGFGDAAVGVGHRDEVELFAVEAAEAQAHARGLVAAADALAGTARGPGILDEVAGHVTEPARQVISVLEGTDTAEEGNVAEAMAALRHATDLLLRRLETTRADSAVLNVDGWVRNERAVGAAAGRLLWAIRDATGEGPRSVASPTSGRMLHLRRALSLPERPQNEAVERLAELRAVLGVTDAGGGSAQPDEGGATRRTGPVGTRPGRRTVMGTLAVAALAAVPLALALQPDRDPAPDRPAASQTPIDPATTGRTVRFDGAVPPEASNASFTEDKVREYFARWAPEAPSEVVVAIRDGEDYIADKGQMPRDESLPPDWLSYMIPRAEMLGMQRTLLQEFPELRQEGTGEPRADTVLWPVMLWDDGTVSVMSPLVGNAFEGQPTGVARLRDLNGVVGAVPLSDGEGQAPDHVLSTLLQGQQEVDRLTTSVPVTSGQATSGGLFAAFTLAGWVLLLALVWAWRMAGDLPAGLRGRAEAAGALREARAELKRLMVREDDRVLNTVVLEVGGEDTAEAAGRRLYDNALVDAWRESEALRSAPRRERRDPAYVSHALQLRGQVEALGRLDEDVAQRAERYVASLG